MALAAGLTLTPQELMAAQGMQNVQQSAGKVTGTVVDQNGEAVIGATIKVKGTTAGAISDLDGNFTINAAPGAELEISYIGMKPITVKATATPMQIVMKDDTHSLNEVVVVGFGTQKKVNLTGAVAMVNGDDLAERPVTSAAQALQGMMPGLQISSSSGSMDATTSINVRGTGTIGQGSSGSPLILIDGMTYSNIDTNPISTIDPNEVESVSVLKDASATAVFGVRGANGVIIITTRRGNEGKAKLSVNVQHSLTSFTRYDERIHSWDYMALKNEALRNDNWNNPDFDPAAAGGYSQDIIDKFKNPLWGLAPSDPNYAQQVAARRYLYADNNWMKLIFKTTTPQTKVNANITGGVLNFLRVFG